MASTSQDTSGPSEQPKEYLVRSNLCFAKNNSKVQTVHSNDPTNKRGYTFLDFVKTTSGLLKGVKQYMNTSTAKAITGMPYCMTEPTEDHIWEKSTSSRQV